MSRAEEAQRNRALMPETARLVDAWRAVFGPRTRFPWLLEGAQVRGTESPQARSMNADQWLRYVKTGQMPGASDGGV